MDRETIKKVAQKIKDISKSEDIELEEIIIFGSRTRKDYTKGSDIDILLVSQSFEGLKWYKRPAIFYRYWDYEKLVEPEFICLTPREFKEKREMKPHIVHEAVEKGIVVK
jgi:predicted nucleotidyltransferase